MSNLHFGTGYLTIRTPDGLPIQVGVLKDVTLSDAGTVKTLYGQERFPIAAGGAEIKITGKAKHCAFSLGLMSQLISPLGTAPAHVYAGAFDELHTVSSGTVSPTNAGHFGHDLGVWNVTTQKWMKPVFGLTVPGANQYKVTGSTYGFHSSANGQDVTLFYDYTLTAGTAYAPSQPLMGKLDTFELTLYNQYEGEKTGLKIPVAVFSKLDYAAKNNDFGEEDLEFEAVQPEAGPIAYYWSSPIVEGSFTIEVVPAVFHSTVMTSPWIVNIHRFNGHTAPINLSISIDGTNNFDGWGVYVNSPTAEGNTSNGAWINDVLFTNDFPLTMTAAPDTFEIIQSGSNPDYERWVEVGNAGVITGTDGTLTADSNPFYLSAT